MIGLKKKYNPNYKNNYIERNLELKEEILCLSQGVIIVILFSYFFYRSIWAVLVLSPGIWFYRKKKRMEIAKVKKMQLEIQFKEAILSVQTNLQAGYSMENAFLESYSDVCAIYGRDSDMAKELVFMKKGLANGDTLEHLLLDLGKRCPDSAVEEFAQVYSIACKTGSKWTDIISKTVKLITQRAEMKEEIEILIHGKKIECRMMCVIPFFILFYMDMTSEGYFDVLYHNAAGIIIMTFCMAAYIFAYLWADKITEIM